MLIPCQTMWGRIEGVETKIYGLEQTMKSVRWKWLPLEAPNAFNNLIKLQELILWGIYMVFKIK